MILWGTFYLCKLLLCSISFSYTLRVGFFKLVSVLLFPRNKRIWGSKYFKNNWSSDRDVDAEGWCGRNEVQGCYQQLSVHTQETFGTNFKENFMVLTLQSSYRIHKDSTTITASEAFWKLGERKTCSSPPTNICKLLVLDRTEKLKCYRNT